MNATDTVTTATMIFNVFIKLIIVLLIIYIGFFFMRRWQLVKGFQNRNQIKIIETTHFSPRRSLHLVQVGGQVFLIGATDQAINLLTEVDQENQFSPEEIENQSAENQQEYPPLIPASLLNFASTLAKRLNRHSVDVVKQDS